VFSTLQILSCLTFQFSPQCACRMLATVTNKAVPVTLHKAGNTPVVAPTLIGPTTVQRLRSVTSTIVDSQISKNNYSRRPHRAPVQHHGPVWSAPSARPLSEQPQHLPSPGVTPAQIQDWAHQNPHTCTMLEYLLGRPPEPRAPSDPRTLPNTTGSINPSAVATSIDVY